MDPRVLGTSYVAFPHAVRGDFAGNLLVYAAGTLLVMARGPKG